MNFTNNKLLFVVVIISLIPALGCKTAHLKNDTASRLTENPPENYYLPLFKLEEMPQPIPYLQKQSNYYISQAYQIYQLESWHEQRKVIIKIAKLEALDDLKLLQDSLESDNVFIAGSALLLYYDLHFHMINICRQIEPRLNWFNRFLLNRKLESLNQSGRTARKKLMEFKPQENWLAKCFRIKFLPYFSRNKKADKELVRRYAIGPFPWPIRCLAVNSLRRLIGDNIQKKDCFLFAYLAQFDKSPAVRKTAINYLCPIIRFKCLAAQPVLDNQYLTDLIAIIRQISLTDSDFQIRMACQSFIECLPKEWQTKTTN